MLIMASSIRIRFRVTLRVNTRVGVSAGSALSSAFYTFDIRTYALYP